MITNIFLLLLFPFRASFWLFRTYIRNIILLALKITILNDGRSTEMGEMWSAGSIVLLYLHQVLFEVVSERA